MQYLIKTITHDTGEVFHDVVKARENEVFTLVDAESEDVARRKARNHSLTNKALEESINEINHRLMVRSVLSEKRYKEWYQKHSSGQAKTEHKKADPLKWLDNFTENRRKDSE